MITEDYVSFKTAKLLKEKGFYSPYCYYYYFPDIESKTPCVTDRVIDINEDKYLAPTLAITMKWLREVHNISIEVIYDCSNDKTETISWWFANIKHINSNSSKENDCLTAYDSYEEAANAAIKHVLKNLI